MNREEEIQNNVTKFLVDHEIFPFSVIYTDCFGVGGLLAITFWISLDTGELLDCLDYSRICDKNGFIILEENNTVMMTGYAFLNFYSKVLNHVKNY